MDDGADPADASLPLAADASLSSAGTELPILSTHRVATGENLYSLSYDFWQDGRLWPFLYYVNRSLLSDPDLLSVGSILEIPDMTENPVEFARTQEVLASAAHLLAYHAYRGAGSDLVAEGILTRNTNLVRLGRFKLEKARWLLYAAEWFVVGFLKLSEFEITEEDQKIVRAYRQRFGPPFGDRDLSNGD